MSQIKTRQFTDIRHALLNKEELALIDVREEAPFAKNHPLFAVNISLSRLELEIYARVPRFSTPITVYDDGEGRAEIAVERLIRLGYQDVALLDGGLAGWRSAGGELFEDVNVPSKSFGELVESIRQTPFLTAHQVKTLIDQQADIVVLDARRFDEYQTMNIPGSISVPGAELVLRARELAPNPHTQIIVNCAGRTRSIIGTQSLVNAGIPNPVAALQNGTIGWTLAGLTLQHQQNRTFSPVKERTKYEASQQANHIANRAGVGKVSLQTLDQWRNDPTRTTYVFDVRTAEEYEHAHLPNARHVAGGQLVQETDHYASVRGARIVLIDDDGVRANMSASWLKQMGWDAYIIENIILDHFTESGPWKAPLPLQNSTQEISPATLHEWLLHDTATTNLSTIVLDFTSSANYVKQHIPSAWFTLRGDLPQILKILPPAERYVLTCGSGLLARLAVSELQALTDKPVYLLTGGTQAWVTAGLPLESGETLLASPRIDRYRRPYEGTDNPIEAMQGYLDWEYGLVEQLQRDGTHGFFVL